MMNSAKLKIAFPSLLVMSYRLVIINIIASVVVGCGGGSCPNVTDSFLAENEVAWLDLLLLADPKDSLESCEVSMFILVA